MHLEQFGDNSTFPWIEYDFVMQRHSAKYEATVGVPALGKQTAGVVMFDSGRPCENEDSSRDTLVYDAV
jgi:hypothetical protein